MQATSGFFALINFKSLLGSGRVWACIFGFWHIFLGSGIYFWVQACPCLPIYNSALVVKSVVIVARYRFRDGVLFLSELKQLPP